MTTERPSLSALQPFGVRREGAAFCVGVSPTKFDQLVDDGRMPAPFRIDGCVVWDLAELRAAYVDLREKSRQPDGDSSHWDQRYGENRDAP